MEMHRTVDSFLTIPAPPDRVRRSERRFWGWDALREASLVGMVALSASWALAELALVLGGF